MGTVKFPCVWITPRIQKYRQVSVESSCWARPRTVDSMRGHSSWLTDVFAAQSLELLARVCWRLVILAPRLSPGVFLGARFPEGPARGGVSAFQPLDHHPSICRGPRSECDEDLSSSRATPGWPLGEGSLWAQHRSPLWALLAVLATGHTCDISEVSPDPGVTWLTLFRLWVYKLRLFILWLWAEMHLSEKTALHHHRAFSLWFLFKKFFFSHSCGTRVKISCLLC